MGHYYSPESPATGPISSGFYGLLLKKEGMVNHSKHGSVPTFFLRHVATNSSNSVIFFKFKMANIFLDIVLLVWDRQILVSSFCLCFCPQLCYSLLTMTPMKRVNTNSWCSPCWLHMTWLTWKELWVSEHTIFLFFFSGGVLYYWRIWRV